MANIIRRIDGGEIIIQSIDLFTVELVISTCNCRYALKNQVNPCNHPRIPTYKKQLYITPGQYNEAIKTLEVLAINLLKKGSPLLSPSKNIMN